MKKLTLLSTSLGRFSGMKDGLGMRWIRSMTTSILSRSGSKACIKFWAYTLSSDGCIDSGMPLNLTLLRHDLSSKSASLALSHSWSSWLSLCTSTKGGERLKVLFFTQCSPAVPCCTLEGRNVPAVSLNRCHPAPPSIGCEKKAFSFWGLWVGFLWGHCSPVRSYRGKF